MTVDRPASLGRRAATVFALFLLVLTLLAVIYFTTGGGDPRLLIQRFGEHGPAATLTDLNRIDQLRAAFNQADGTPRLILLLSPT